VDLSSPPEWINLKATLKPEREGWSFGRVWISI